MIKVFTLNKNNKIELTKKELEQLLNESFWEGYNKRNLYVYNSPSINTPYTTTPYWTYSTADSGITITANSLYKNDDTDDRK